MADLINQVLFQGGVHERPCPETQGAGIPESECPGGPHSSGCYTAVAKQSELFGVWLGGAHHEGF